MNISFTEEETEKIKNLIRKFILSRGPASQDRIFDYLISKDELLTEKELKTLLEVMTNDSTLLKEGPNYRCEEISYPPYSTEIGSNLGKWRLVVHCTLYMDKSQTTLELGDVNKFLEEKKLNTDTWFGKFDTQDLLDSFVIEYNFAADTKAKAWIFKRNDIVISAQSWKNHSVFFKTKDIGEFRDYDILSAYSGVWVLLHLIEEVAKKKSSIAQIEIVRSEREINF